MKVIDSHSVLNGNTEAINIDSDSLDIIADNGKTLFTIKQQRDGITISGGSFCKHNGKLLDTYLNIRPIASNVVFVSRDEYKDSNNGN